VVLPDFRGRGVGTVDLSFQAVNEWSDAKAEGKTYWKSSTFTTVPIH